MASMIVSLGRTTRFRSAMRWARSLWISPRLPPITPMTFFSPSVSLAMTWCLATGTLM